MSTSSFSSRVQDAGATLRVARPAWMVGGPSGHRRLMLLALLGIAGLLAIVYLTFRLTPLSTVQRVTVVGVQGPDAPEIRQAIERAAMGQSTLGFGDAAVKRAVAKTASITGVTVHTKFPHGVQVEVRQLLAVGAVDTGGRKVAVSSDGRLLPDWDVGELPLIRGARASQNVVQGSGRAAASILGVAPAELLAHVARVDDGTVVRLADGPALLFRDTNRINAKWAAAVAVLGDAGTSGATWIDLRVPEAPVAGKGAPPGLPAKNAKVGKVAGVSDALATAERAASATGGPVEGDAAGTAPAAAPSTPTTPAAATSTPAAATPTPAAAPA
ncbi:cell division protein FtsQ/DivIB, partial [Patulibacter sp.]|uniref:cell division protein FtsQ/DivIB n=1 Tax=Patulibacter sp. TaxID=1912859 RepID=UPI002720289C